MIMMSTVTAERAALWAAVLCAWAAVLCCAAPPRWQPGTEATAAVTDAWADEFDLDGDKEWLGDDAPISPSSIPQQSVEYEDYDDDDAEEEDDSRPSMMDLEEHQEDSEPSHQAEFLFVPPSRDNRLMLQDDDDDQNGPIKVRHTGKNPYPEVIDGEDDSNDSSHQFEFTIDNNDDDEEDDKDNEVENDDTNDFVLDDAAPPRSKEDKTREDDDDDDDDDDNFVSDGDSNDNDPMFESPEEDSQVIYGDHVFLY